MTLGALPQKAAVALGSYLRRHPDEVLRAARNAVSLKFGVPLAGLRWLASELGAGKVPSDLVLEARNPGLFASASFDLMKTPVKGAATIIIEKVDLRADALLLDLRLEDISLKVTDPRAGTPVAALLQSGALDLSRPGDLLSYMPKRPEVVVGARENVLTLDLMKHPRLSRERARRVVALLVSLCGVETIRTEGRHLDLAFQAFPQGPAAALEQLKRLF